MLKRSTPALALAGVQVAERARQHGGRRGYVITAISTIAADGCQATVERADAGTE